VLDSLFSSVLSYSSRTNTQLIVDFIVTVVFIYVQAIITFLHVVVFQVCCAHGVCMVCAHGVCAHGVCVHGVCTWCVCTWCVCSQLPCCVCFFRLSSVCPLSILGRDQLKLICTGDAAGRWITVHYTPYTIQYTMLVGGLDPP
jgi:hypothetical protein